MMRSAATGINHDSLPAYLGKSLVFAAFVYLSAHFGGLFRFNDSSVSLLGLTSGCALAGLLLLGANYWPALLLASVLGAVSFGMSPSSAILMGLGTTTGSLSAVAFW